MRSSYKSRVNLGPRSGFQRHLVKLTPPIPALPFPSPPSRTYHRAIVEYQVVILFELHTIEHYRKTYKLHLHAAISVLRYASIHHFSYIYWLLISAGQRHDQTAAYQVTMLVWG